MHVLLLGPYPPPQGGINRNMLAIREELLKNGHLCSIIATSRSSVITPEPDVYHPRSIFGLLRLLFSLDYEVHHLHVGGSLSTRVLALISACSFFNRRRSVLTVHSGAYPQTKEAMVARPASVRGLIFRCFARVIVVNEQLTDVFIRFGVKRENIHQIYPFFHKAPFADIEIPAGIKAFAESHTPFLLTVGLLEREYDLSMQIAAMESIVKQFPQAGLIIVGSGSMQRELEKDITSKSYADNICLAGDVEHAITLHLINDADMLLRTTLFDGDAISVREALFLDTPVIATDNGMRPEGVNLIPVGDEAALVDKIFAAAKSGSKKKSTKLDDMSNIVEIVNLYRDLTKLAS